MACIARYTDVNEFLEEVTADPSLCQWGVVRITAQSDFDFQCERLSLIAGVVIGGTLIELRQVIGLIRDPARRVKYIDGYLALKDRIEREAMRCGLKVRAGWWIELAGLPTRFQ